MREGDRMGAAGLKAWMKTSALGAEHQRCGLRPIQVPIGNRTKRAGGIRHHGGHHLDALGYKQPQGLIKIIDSLLLLRTKAAMWQLQQRPC